MLSIQWFRPLCHHIFRMLRGFPTVSYFDSNSEEYYNGVACFRLHVEVNPIEMKVKSESGSFQKASRLYACLYCLISVSGDFVFGRFFSLSLSLLLIPLLLIGVFKRARTFLLVSIGVAVSVNITLRNLLLVFRESDSACTFSFSVVMLVWFHVDRWEHLFTDMVHH